MTFFITFWIPPSYLNRFKCSTKIFGSSLIDNLRLAFTGKPVSEDTKCSSSSSAKLCVSASSMLLISFDSITRGNVKKVSTLVSLVSPWVTTLSYCPSNKDWIGVTLTSALSSKMFNFDISSESPSNKQCRNSWASSCRPSITLKGPLLFINIL